MAVKQNTVAIHCSTVKCGQKSKSEKSIELAFTNAKKSGWSKDGNKHFCPSCTHKNIKLSESVKSTKDKTSKKKLTTAK